MDRFDQTSETISLDQLQQSMQDFLGQLDVGNIGAQIEASNRLTPSPVPQFSGFTITFDRSPKPTAVMDAIVPDRHIRVFLNSPQIQEVLTMSPGQVSALHESIRTSEHLEDALTLYTDLRAEQAKVMQVVYAYFHELSHAGSYAKKEKAPQLVITHPLFPGMDIQTTGEIVELAYGTLRNRWTTLSGQVIHEHRREFEILVEAMNDLRTLQIVEQYFNTHVFAWKGVIINKDSVQGLVKSLALYSPRMAGLRIVLRFADAIAKARAKNRQEVLHIMSSGNARPNAGKDLLTALAPFFTGTTLLEELKYVQHTAPQAIDLERRIDIHLRAQGI